MLLAAIEATNFRNLSGRIEWGPRLNIIYGNNGQGKTNWLEAIYLLARTKSFRTQHLQEAIQFGEELAVIRGKVTIGADLERDLQVSLHDNSKTIFVNSKRETLARYLTQLQVFSFTAADLDVVRGMPEARRRFLDRGISSLRPAYLKTIADYAKVLKQKNRVLQLASENEIGPDKVEDLLAPWNEQMVRLGVLIHRARQEYVAGLSASVESNVFEDRDVTTDYVSSLENKGDMSDYESLLRSRIALRVGGAVAW